MQFVVCPLYLNKVIFKSEKKKDYWSLPSLQNQNDSWVILSMVLRGTSTLLVPSLLFGSSVCTLLLAFEDVHPCITALVSLGITFCWQSRALHIGKTLLALLSLSEYVSSPVLSRDSDAATAAAAKSLQLCLTLCNPIDGSPPGSPVPGILQARTLEWVAISFSNA